jgi:D-serine deaminase-like pyridoxal phosphate-dependent protein
LLGKCEAPDVLLAMQPVGPNITRFGALIRKFPKTKFSTLVDNAQSIREIGFWAESEQREIPVFLDLNVGMNRTGVVPSDHAIALYKMIHEHPFLRAAGLHAYDGHIRNPDPEERKRECDTAFGSVTRMKSDLETLGILVTEVIAGGSPTFPIHAKREGVIASPGTTLLWDARYASSFPEMEFLIASLLLTRVISKPADGILCLDLGHKSVAPEMVFPRVHIYGMENAEQTGQSEEHLVLKTARSEEVHIGKVYYAAPVHVCPTVAKYPEALTVEGGKITGSWKVAARDH